MSGVAGTGVHCSDFPHSEPAGRSVVRRQPLAVAPLESTAVFTQ